ncbi:MAG: NDP-sugar synthase [Armatimonadetes bacterium]|nr:NDP-sugar synthase [Armatimonadota bacterium]
MQAVILAGGNGTRLRPLIATVPKPMLPLFDMPILEHSIRLLAKHGIRDIIITTSPYADGLMDYFGDGANWGVRIRYSVEHEPMGTAGAVKLARKMIQDTFIVFSGDVVSDFDLKEAIISHKSTSAIATILLAQVDDPTQFGIVRCDSTGRLRQFKEKPRSHEVTSNIVSTGIYIFEPEVLSCIPYDEPCDFGRQLFPRMLNNQEPIYGLSPRGYWCDVGNLANYRRLHTDALTGPLNVEIPGREIADGIHIGEDVDIHPSAQLSGPLFLGNGVTVRRGANVGKGTVVGAGTCIDEGAEVVGSIIGGGSYLGPNASVADCIIGGEYRISEGETARGRAFIEYARYETPEPTVPIRREVPKPARPAKKAREAKAEPLKR